MNKYIVIMVVLIAIGCNENEKSSRYFQSPLPPKFSYKILLDESSDALEKNQLTVEINQKIDVGQIATLAEKIYSSKPKQRRFYIFYLLPGMEIGKGAYAISHYDPDLNITILGSTTDKDVTTETLSEKLEQDIILDGELVGKWAEQKYTSGNHIIYKKQGKTYLKHVSKGEVVIDQQLTEVKTPSGTRYNYTNGGYNNEYLIVTEKGILEFYNSENVKFTEGIKID